VAKILDYACKMIISMGLEEKEGKESEKYRGFCYD